MSATLPIEEFGHQLLDSGDLDPVYTALHRLRTEPAPFGFDDAAQMKRWLVAYWCLYSVGEACYLSEARGAVFWEKLLEAASNETLSPINARWRRAAERRHWRGAAAVKCVHTLVGRYRYCPELMVDYCAGVPGDTAVQVMRRVREHHLFGDWIAFKVADMVDRCLGQRVSFAEAEVFMFDSPREAAVTLWLANHPDQVALSMAMTSAVETHCIRWSVDYLTKFFSDRLAPPLMDRPVGLQEVETILCKWKSHRNGHYPLFNDIDEIHENLHPWLEHCATARAFSAQMPRRES